MNVKRIENELDQKLLLYSKCLSNKNTNEEQLQLEIEQLIQQLQDAGHSIQDYKQEFKKLKQNIQQHRAKDSLLLLPSHSQQDSQQQQFLVKQMEQREQLIDIHRLNDQLISNAQDVRQELHSQRQSFQTSSNSLSHLLSSSFFQISSTMTHIWRRKKRDVIILAMVIAICLFVTFYLLF